MSEPGPEHQDFLPRSWVGKDAEQLAEEENIAAIIFSTTHTVPSEQDLQIIERTESPVFLLSELYRKMGKVKQGSRTEELLVNTFVEYEAMYHRDYWLWDEKRQPIGRDVDKIEGLFDETDKFDGIVPALRLLNELRLRSGKNKDNVIGADHILRVIIKDRKDTAGAVHGAVEPEQSPDAITEAG